MIEKQIKAIMKNFHLVNNKNYTRQHHPDKKDYESESILIDLPSTISCPNKICSLDICTP